MLSDRTAAAAATTLTRRQQQQHPPQQCRNYMKFQTDSRSHITRQTDLKLAVWLLLWQITDSNKLCSGQLASTLCAISFYYISRVCLSVCVYVFFLLPSVFFS